MTREDSKKCKPLKTVDSRDLCCMMYPPPVSCVLLYCQQLKHPSIKRRLQLYRDEHFPPLSARSTLCAWLPSARSTRSWAWSRCRRPRPAHATANVDGMAATRARGKERERKTKRKKKVDPLPPERES